MSTPFIAEVKIFGGNFAPRGYALCNGQIIAISQNTALFALLGTNYGGNGQSTFGLPDLRARVPLGAGQGPGLSEYVLGEADGAASVSLISTEVPMHTHAMQAFAGRGGTATKTPATNASLTTSQNGSAYLPSGGATAPMDPTVAGISGGSLPHNNTMPFLAVTFIIALQGIFPQRP